MQAMLSHTSALPAPAAVTSMDINSWNFQQPVHTVAPTSSAGGRGKKKVKEVVYPIFAYYATLVSDPFWVDIFTQASYGKMPKKFSFNEMTLCYNKGQKQGARALYQTPESAQHAIQFFKTYGAIYSPIDQQTALFQHQTCQVTLEPLTWANTNRKTKISLISNYVTEIATTMQLSTKETEQLAETIHLGIGSKIFNRDNIGIQLHKIVVIQGLCWDGQTRLFYPDPNLKPLRSNSRSTNKSKSKTSNTMKNKGLVPMFRTNWTKFLGEQLNCKQLTADQQQAFTMNMWMNSSQSYHSENGSTMSDSESDGEL